MAPGEGDVEFALVVVISEDSVLMDAAHIDDYIACLQHFGVSRADQCGIAVGGEESEKVDRECFVCVEVTIVSAYHWHLC